jgi:exopolyphosphatase/pppGpp-phosphohydrolase
MRLGVLDVGSNTVHMLVVDAHPGARPLPAFSHKVDLRLAAQLEDGSRLSCEGAQRLEAIVTEALRIAEDKGVEDFLAFATSAVRDAVNGEEVLDGIAERTGARIRVVSGESEARLTFLAARRWFGWSSGRLLVLDIGGGSLEMAAGPAGSPGTGSPPTRRPPTRCGRSAATCARRSPGTPGGSCAGAPPTTRSARPRPSGNLPGSRALLRPARAST